MKKTQLIPVVLVAFTGFVWAEGAIKDIKPGLWEIQHKTTVDGQALPDMNKMLEQVPPEMRGQVAAMMAKNGAGMSDKGLTICMTAEQIAKQQYGNDPKNHCQMNDIKQDGNVTHMKMQCNTPKGEGETTITRLSPESWTSVSAMTMERNGAQHTMNSEAAAKWLGADCGDVKPVGQQAVDTQKVADEQKAAGQKTNEPKTTEQTMAEQKAMQEKLMNTKTGAP